MERTEGQDEDGMFIIVYDFKGGKNPKEFYKVLNDLASERYLLTKVQKSVISTKMRVGALAVNALAEH